MSVLRLPEAICDLHTSDYRGRINVSENLEWRRRRTLRKIPTHIGCRASAREIAEIERLRSQYDVSQSALLRTWIREGMDRLRRGEPLVLKPIARGTPERDAA
jgi:hypothetical protein